MEEEEYVATNEVKGGGLYGANFFQDTTYSFSGGVGILARVFGEKLDNAHLPVGTFGVHVRKCAPSVDSETKSFWTYMHTHVLQLENCDLVPSQLFLFISVRGMYRICNHFVLYVEHFYDPVTICTINHFHLCNI